MHTYKRRYLIDAIGSYQTNQNQPAISYTADPVTTALFIKITPKSFRGKPSMRVDVIGCLGNPCNNSVSFNGLFGDCKSYVSGKTNHDHCDSDNVESEDTTSALVSTVCKVSCGECGLKVETNSPTAAPTAAPTDVPTNTDWPMVCSDDPNFLSDWVGAYGNCDSYNKKDCNVDTFEGLMCNFNFCKRDGIYALHSTHCPLSKMCYISPLNLLTIANLPIRRRLLLP